MLKGNFDISLDFLRTGPPPLIGVDICSSAVKIVELSVLSNKGGFVVERYVIEPLAKGVVSEGNINNLDAVAEGLRRAWKRVGTRIKNVALVARSKYEKYKGFGAGDKGNILLQDHGNKASFRNVKIRALK